MTCIVGLIDKKTNEVYIGGDSAGVAGCNITIRKDKKVFIRDGKFIIGFTTSFRMGQLLMCDDRFTIRDQNNDEDDFHYMVNAFVPAVQKLFTEGGFITKDKEEFVGGTFLLGYNKKLYKIDSDFQVCESMNDYDACGCGQEYALGSLFTTNKANLSPEKRIYNALESASEFSTAVAPPFNVLKL